MESKRSKHENPINKLVRLAMGAIRSHYPNVPSHAIPKPRYTDKTSNGLTRCIVDYINLNGYQAERINSTGRILDSRKKTLGSFGSATLGGVRWIKSSSQNGTADISATIRGRSVKIEVKCKATGDNYQSQAQKDYQEKIEQAGGIYLIARDFWDFFTWYHKFTKS
ncbi:hypothetical protein [Arenibacter lacus]|uniref:hypothetical protein n=1 Tax=Arenibacter lacus TaxID=2608629 RepID=UPI00123E256B|nr:hypothetical protein [Arenibacter lacus]